MAVVELGMEPTKFWELEYYEWTLWLLRITTIHNRRTRDEEMFIELERNTMALHANLHSKKRYTGRDFYKLSHDEKERGKETGQSIWDNLPEEFKTVKRRKRG